MSQPMTDLEFRPRRALIFSRHMKNYFDGTIAPKLERFNIIPIRVLDPSSNMSCNMSDAEVVLIFLELMDPVIVGKVRAEAKKQGKRCIALHRQIGGWEKSFRDFEDQDRREAAKVVPITKPTITIRVSPTPAEKLLEGMGREKREELARVAGLPPAPTPPPETDPETEQFLEMYEEENRMLAAEKAELTVKLSASHELITALEGQVAGLTSAAEATKKRMQSLTSEVADAKASVSAPASGTLIIENRRLAGEVQSLEDQIADVRDKLRISDGHRQTLETKTKTLESQLRTATTAAATTQSAKDEASTQFEQRMQQLARHITEREEHIGKLEQELEKEKGIVSGLTFRERTACTALAQRDRDVTQLQARVEELTSKVQEQAGKLSAATRKAQQQQHTEVHVPLDKQLLMAWIQTLNDARAGAAAAFADLLKMAGHIGMSTEDLLKLVSGKK